ncbi:hypothetical protein XFF6992_480003 [Xanthomonas citri pv. fuscans]|nr:hypothetical protein XFF6992_480003 [Xanthomonas citri pv. fuscans]SOO34917.1 hypothetical protein XFF6994_4820004 [Xanthomonas citri pv. fuscans]
MGSRERWAEKGQCAGRGGVPGTLVAPKRACVEPIHRALRHQRVVTRAIAGQVRVLGVGNGTVSVLLNSLGRARMGRRHRGEAGVHKCLEMPVKRGISVISSARAFTSCSRA